MLFRTAAASLLCIASVSAAEDFWLDEALPFVDIRLGYGLVPKPDVYKVDVADYGLPHFIEVNTVDSDQASNLSYSIVGGVMDPVGPLIGIEMTYASSSQELIAREINGVAQPIPADASSLQYRTLGGSLLAGVGFALDKRFHLEALGVLGGGSLDLDFPNGAADEQNDGQGWYWNAGVRGGIYFTWRRLVIGALCEYGTTEYRAEANWANSNTSVNDSYSGLGWRMEIGYHIQ